VGHVPARVNAAAQPTWAAVAVRKDQSGAKRLAGYAVAAILVLDKLSPTAPGPRRLVK
jgi:hypothetical protein